MKSRSLLLLVPAALLALGVLSLLRRGSPTAAAPGPAAPGPALAAQPAKAAPRPTLKSAAKPKVPDISRDARLFVAVRASLRARFQAVLDREGPRAAFTLALRELETSPKDLEERVRRAYILRFLPWLAMKDPLLQDDVLRTLERHAGTDADPYARFVGVATLFDCSVLYTQPTPSEGFFFARIAQRLTPEVAGPDQGVLDLRRRDLPRLIALARELYGREADRDARELLVQLVAEEKKPETVDFLSQAAAGDADVDVRYWSFMGLAKAGKTPATVDALRRGSDDPDARNRLAALDAMVRLGACDDLVVSRLLTTPEKSTALYQVLGQAYAAGSAPGLAARLRDSLVDPDPRTRRMALHGIVSSGRKEFLTDLEPAGAKEKDPAMKREIEFAVLKLKGEEPPGLEDTDDEPKGPGR